MPRLAIIESDGVTSISEYLRDKTIVDFAAAGSVYRLNLKLDSQPCEMNDGIERGLEARRDGPDRRKILNYTGREARTTLSHGSSGGADDA